MTKRDIIAEDGTYLGTLEDEPIDACPPDREMLRERRLAELRKEADRLRFVLGLDDRAGSLFKLPQKHIDQIRAQLAATEALIAKGGWPGTASKNGEES